MGDAALPKPRPKHGEVVIRVRGFGINHAEMHMRRDIAAQVASGKLEAAPSRVFSFDEVHEAHRTMEAGDGGGKMVVVMQ